MLWLEELKAKFDALSDADKIEFVKIIMSSMCSMFKGNPQDTKLDVMSLYIGIMKDCKTDMSQMMSMMTK